MRYALAPLAAHRAPLRALLLSLCTLLAFATLAAFAAPAFAEDKKIEAAAKDALKKVEDDFLAGDYAKAIEKLKKVSSDCGADKCTPATKAQVFRDLGAMYFYAKKNGDAVNAFVEALKIEPDAPLNMNYKTPDVDAVYTEAKKKAGGGGGGTKPPPTTGGGTGEQPSGDFGHDPVPEQAVRTPLPVYVTYSGSSTIAKVIVKYKGFGMSEFKPIELSKMGDGWGGLIPCLDVTQGAMQYYVQGFDASNDPVANSGDRNKTYKVPIKATIDGEAPHLPGASAPKQCQDTGDCPPDFPGCKKGGGDSGGDTSNKKDEGEECDDETQCKSNTCTHGKCVGSGDDTAKPKGKNPRIWIGVAAGFDFVVLPSDNDVCARTTAGTPGRTDPPGTPPPAFSSSGYYYCVNGSADFPANKDENDKIAPARFDQVKGGLNPANLRVMATLDYAVNANLLVGVRLGYVINTYPGSSTSTFFAPVHLEARGTYIIGKDALWKPGFAPMVFLGTGASQFDSNVGVTVAARATATNPNPPPAQVNAWLTSGPFFVSLGGGGRYAISPKSALYGAIKLTGVFGGQAGFLPAVGPELGVQFGF